MRGRKGSAFLTAVFLCSFFGDALASYHASSDTGTEIFDFIEEEHRKARQVQIDEQMESLKKDVASKEKTDFARDASSAFDFVAQNITYDFATGDFTARGGAVLTEHKGRRILGENIFGNTKEKRLAIPHEGEFLSVAKGFPPFHLYGKNLRYFSLSKTGSLEDFSGKVGREFISGKKIEFFPAKILIYDGKATKSSAKKREYLWQAKQIEIFPDKKMLLHDASFSLFGKTIYKKKLHATSVEGEKNSLILPRAGFDTGDGWWLAYDDSVPLLKNISLGGDFFYSTRHGLHNIGEVKWKNGANSLALQYGFFEDRDQRWLKKEPSVVYNYVRKVPHTAWQADFYAEYGFWKEKDIKSRHRYMGIAFRRKPFVFDKYRLFLSGRYGMTLEGYDESRTEGFSYDAVLLREFSKNFWSFIGYHYAAINAQTTLFSYGMEDCSRSIDTGFSLRLTPNDRVVVGTKYDLDARNFRDVDYYWYHNMHSVETIIRYREKRDRWQFLLQFTPW